MAKCWCSCTSMRSCVLGCMLACCFVLSCSEGEGFWFLVGPPEATEKLKGGRRKIAAPNRPQGGLLGPARVGRSGQQVTAQPAPPGAVTGRKKFVFGGEGGLRVGVVVVRFLGGGGGGGSAGLRKGRSVAPRRGAVRGCHTGAQCETVLGRSEALGSGAACGCARGAAWSCTGALPGAVMGAAAAQGAQRGTAQGRSVGMRKGRGMRLRRGVTWSWAGGQRGTEQGRSAGLHRRAACGCIGAQRETAQGRRGWARGAAWD